jgi:LPXTG-motif cell wall-anchored protein
LAIPEVEEDTLITVTATNEVTCVPEKETTTTTSTTVPTEVLPIVVTSTTTTVPAEVLPIVVTTTVGTEVSPVVAETLPFTGSNDVGWLVLAGVALTLGTILVVGSRREDTEA